MDNNLALNGVYNMFVYKINEFGSCNVNIKLKKYSTINISFKWKERKHYLS